MKAFSPLTLEMCFVNEPTYLSLDLTEISCKNPRDAEGCVSVLRLSRSLGLCYPQNLRPGESRPGGPGTSPVGGRPLLFPRGTAAPSPWPDQQPLCPQPWAMAPSAASLVVFPSWFGDLLQSHPYPNILPLPRSNIIPGLTEHGCAPRGEPPVHLGRRFCSGV